MQCFFPLKGKTLNDNNHTTTFNVTDVPFRVKEDVLVLRKRENSPMIDLNTVGRCSDLHSVDGDIIAEGDVITSSNDSVQYTVKWINGFKAVSGSKIIPICDIKLPRVIGRSKVPNVRHYLFYKTGNIRWNLFDCVDYDSENDILLLNRKDLSQCSATEFQQLFMYSSRPLCIGSKVILKDGRIAVITLQFGDIKLFVDGCFLPYDEHLIEMKGD